MEREIKKCANCREDFVVDAQDFEFYAKIKVPAPTWCSECRAKRRFIWRNEKTLWKRKSSVTGKEIVSMIPEPFAACENEYWWSDKWDVLDYGREYDFSRPFFEQLKSLIRGVPWSNISSLNAVNSEYCNNVLDLKNCYFVFDSGYCEDSAYLIGTKKSKNSFDLTDCISCERSARSFFCENSHSVFYSVDCRECLSAWFCRDCVGCSHCFGCAGLRNKSYYIFNKPYAKEDYFEAVKKMNVGSHRSLSVILEKTRKAWQSVPVKYMHGRQNVNISGGSDYIYHSKNIKDSFWVGDSEESRYLQSCAFGPTLDSYDLCIGGLGAERCYECSGVGLRSANVKFSVLTVNCRQLNYSVNCHNVSDCFGCAGLRDKQYCILNKQYTKEEYKKLTPKIIEHMNNMPYVDVKGRIYKYGEFFPPELSPFAYNETIAHDYLPLQKSQAEQEGFAWNDPERKEYPITMAAEDLPDHIEDVDEKILSEIIECAHRGTCNEQCRTAFRVISPELKFYKENSLPLPRLCPNCRHSGRLLDRNSMKFFHRACDCGGIKTRDGRYQNIAEHSRHDKNPCSEVFETSYASDRPEIVYCEKCYQAEVA